MTYIAIALFLVLFYINILPLFKRKFRKEKLLNFNEISQIKPLVLDTSLKMLVTNKVYMSFNDEDSLYSKLSKLKGVFSNNFNHKEYAYFNFPRAWLMIGLIDEYEVSKDATILTQLENQCDKLIDSEGNLLFNFNKIDQSLFGVVFIRLNKLIENKRFVNAADTIFSKVKDFTIENDLILYRKESKVIFVDTLGMICPFLYEYGFYFKKEEVIELANKQVDFYLKNGLDEKSCLPFHAIDLEKGIRIGSINWARGLGWFLIGLAFAIKNNESKKDSFSLQFNKIVNLLDNLKVNKEYWSQFLGHTNDYNIDSSATLMFYYSMLMVDSKLVSQNDLYISIKKSINKEGFILNSSGDTMYINKYSLKKGQSELTQGLLMSLISKL